MNSTEQKHIKDLFGENKDGKTMEDYFILLGGYTSGVVTIDELKSEFKDRYPDISDWSF